MPFQPAEMSEVTLRRLVDNLSRHMKAHPFAAPPKRSQLQEALAATLGWPSYHAAISEIKRKAPTQPSKVSALPEKHLPEQGLFPAEWEKMPWFPAQWRSGHAKGSSADSAPPARLASSVLLIGSESARRKVFSGFIAHNPAHAVCQVKGPMSILPDLPGASRIKKVPAAALLATGTAAEITEMIASLMHPPSADDAMWHARSISLLSSVVLALVYLRDTDNKTWPLTVATIRDCLVFDNLVRLSLRRDLPVNSLRALRSYLRSIPGFKENQPSDSQPEVVLEQHGYLQMQFTAALDKIDSHPVAFLQKDSVAATSRLDVQLHEKVNSEFALVQRSIQSWVDCNPEGLLVFDVPPVGSPLWSWLANNLPAWVDRGLSIWIGVASQGDIPPSALLALSPRMEYTIRLGQSPV